jgi:hypothetical protein
MKDLLFSRGVFEVMGRTRRSIGRTAEKRGSPSKVENDKIFGRRSSGPEGEQKAKYDEEDKEGKREENGDQDQKRDEERKPATCG